MIPSGAGIDAPLGSRPGMFLAATPEERPPPVGEIAAQRWAAVKSYSMPPEPAYLAVAVDAARRGPPFVGHIPEGVDPRHRARGQPRLDGARWRLSQACSTEEAAMGERERAALTASDPRGAPVAEMAGFNRILLETREQGHCEAVIAEVAKAGMPVVPTLVLSDFDVGARPAADALRMQTLPTAVREAWTGPDSRLEAMTEGNRALADQPIALDLRTCTMAQAGRVPILAGTDDSFANPYIFHGYSLLDEPDRYVGAGHDPRRALITATVAPARFLGLPGGDGTLDQGDTATPEMLGAMLRVEALRPGDGIRIASQTKTFVAAATLRLPEEEQLGLDAGVAGVLLPGKVALLAGDGYDPAAITPRMLLQHASGLFDVASAEAFMARAMAEPRHRWTRGEQLALAMEGGEPLAAPAAALNYSDTGYILLGDILETVNGAPMAQAVRELLDFGLLEPSPPGAPAARTSTWALSTPADPSVDLFGGGGLASRLSDLARFCRAPLRGAGLEEPASLAAMIKPSAHSRAAMPGG